MALGLYDHLYGTKYIDTLPTTLTEVMMRERQSIADREQNRFNRHDPNANINQMMYEDMVNQQRMMYYNLPPREYYQCTPSYELPHYCKAVPEHLENYYQQLLNYYKQSGYKPKEKLCCSLNNLKIKY